MARYKVLKGVAHDIGHTFTSLMNYVSDDYVMGHVLRFARRSGRDTLMIDFVAGEAGPPELLLEPISEVPTRYRKWFWEMVQQQGSDPSYVHSAKLTLKFNLAIERPAAIAPEFQESPYECNVLIKDSRGKDYTAHFEGWWFPERHDLPHRKAQPWWKVWALFNNIWRRLQSSKIVL
jgi:hypothetical protein